MSAGTLYSTAPQHKSRIIKAAAAYGGITLDDAVGYTHFETNKTPEFLAKFPHGKIPALETKDGFKLFESLAIARYVASLAPNSGLLGHSTEDAALVDQWASFVSSELDGATSSIKSLVTGKWPYNKPLHTTQTENSLRALKTLNTHLETRTFFVGERITLADLWVAGLVHRASEISIDKALRAELPHLIRHLDTIVNQPKLKEIYGPVTVLDKPLQFTPPAKDKKEKEVKPAPPPKAEKPAKKPKDDDDDDEDGPPPPPKVKNPLDDLPKSSFDLEQWKREYSNKDTRGAGGALEWFYQNFDKEGFSIWRVDFKYNEELTQTFMSSNQITGFFNRLEASRKYLFGSVGVLGTNNNSIIAGALILRGPKPEGVVDVAPDWESYTYNKINLDDPKDKEFFEGALAWDLAVDGKSWADGKNFK